MSKYEFVNMKCVSGLVRYHLMAVKVGRDFRYFKVVAVFIAAILNGGWVVALLLGIIIKMRLPVHNAK